MAEVPKLGPGTREETVHTTDHKKWVHFVSIKVEIKFKSESTCCYLESKIVPVFSSSAKRWSVSQGYSSPLQTKAQELDSTV